VWTHERQRHPPRDHGARALDADRHLIGMRRDAKSLSERAEQHGLVRTNATGQLIESSARRHSGMDESDRDHELAALAAVRRSDRREGAECPLAVRAWRWSRLSR
jgi:hypothetical protein